MNAWPARQPALPPDRFRWTWEPLAYWAER